MSSPRRTLLRRALVADDGQEGGEAALSVAPFVAEHLARSLTVVHAIDVPRPEETAGSPDDVLDYRVVLERRAVAWLEGRIAERFGEAASNVHGVVYLGDPSRVVRRTAEDLEAELIVVGPHHREHLFDFGGTQGALFSGTSCHVWSQPAAFEGVDEVLAPVDLSPRSMRSLEVARDVAETLGVGLRVLYASAPPQFADAATMYGEVPSPTYVVDAMHEAARVRFDDAMAEFDRRAVERVETEFAIAEPVSAILEAQGPNRLAVLGTRGHTGIAAAIFGGVTYAVLRAGKGPVLAVHA
ncbi:MAG: universal stress protein [Planctomycetota bacterium]